ncbi:MAG: enoyl-CoA hydratase/isomerase family protein [Pararhodobacter sp.]|nr:enoyl-CoA hydratase/isomerase family protein [Pararhodobacter sp.]
MGLILTEHPSEGVVHLVLNRADRRNALDLEIRKALAQRFRELGEDATLRCVVLSGAGGCFSGGADIADMARIDAIEMYHRHTERLWGAVADCPVPVIAAVEGFALGGGLELAMHADIIVTHASAKLGQPEVKVGIMPGAGGTQRLMRAVGKYRAMLMCLTGDIVSGEDAAGMGLVSMLAPEGEVLDRSLAIAQRIALLPPIAVAQIKEVMLAGADAPLSSALALERKAVQLLFATQDKTEGMNAYLEKRAPRFQGR